MRRLRTLLLLVCCTTMLSIATAADTIRVACIGNSVTYGYGHQDPKATSYPTQLGQMLGNGFDVRNFGHSGATLL